MYCVVLIIFSKECYGEIFFALPNGGEIGLFLVAADAAGMTREAFTAVDGSDVSAEELAAAFRSAADA